MKIKSHCQDIIYLSYWYQMSSDTSALLIFTDCHCFCCNKRLHKRRYLPLHLISSDFLITTEISPWDNKYLSQQYNVLQAESSECSLENLFSIDITKCLRLTLVRLNIFMFYAIIKCIFEVPFLKMIDFSSLFECFLSHEFQVLMFDWFLMLGSCSDLMFNINKASLCYVKEGIKYKKK